MDQLSDVYGVPMSDITACFGYSDKFIRKDSLRDGVWYRGKCRNATFAQWDATGNRFLYLRQKFDMLYVDALNGPEDDNNFDLFFPMSELKVGNGILQDLRSFLKFDEFEDFTLSRAIHASQNHYLCAKMSSLAGNGFEKFNLIQKQMESKGYKVLNPATLGNGQTMEPHLGYRESVPMMAKADVVILLPGWKRSIGARLEKQCADHMEIPCIELKWKEGKERE